MRTLQDSRFVVAHRFQPYEPRETSQTRRQKNTNSPVTRKTDRDAHNRLVHVSPCDCLSTVTIVPRRRFTGIRVEFAWKCWCSFRGECSETVGRKQEVVSINLKLFKEIRIWKFEHLEMWNFSWRDWEIWEFEYSEGLKICKFAFPTFQSLNIQVGKFERSKIWKSIVISKFKNLNSRSWKFAFPTFQSLNIQVQKFEDLL